MKIAFYIEDTVQSGGSYFQSWNNCVLALRQLSHRKDEILIICPTEDIERKARVAQMYGASIDAIRQTRLQKLKDWVRFRLARACVETPRLREFLLRSNFERRFRERGVDIVVFLSPSVQAKYLSTLPYVFTVWDLCHQSQGIFPEAGGLGEWLHRESIFRQVLPRAFRILTNSRSIAQDIEKLYGIGEEKIMVVPLSPQKLEVKRNKEISVGEYTVRDSGRRSRHTDYILYPARFWPHKNHVYILKAMKGLKENDGHRIKAVFVGGSGGTANNKRHIMNEAKYLGVESDIVFIDLCEWNELELLYRKSLALVMPTYFGPTNVPILEAFQMETPAVYSDLPGFRNEYGQACLYADLQDPDSLRDILRRLLNDSGARAQQVDLGRKYIESLGHTINSNSAFLDMVKDLDAMIACW